MRDPGTGLGGQGHRGNLWARPRRCGELRAGVRCLVPELASRRGRKFTDGVMEAVEMLQSDYKRKQVTTKSDLRQITRACRHA